MINCLSFVAYVGNVCLPISFAIEGIVLLLFYIFAVNQYFNVAIHISTHYMYLSLLWIYSWHNFRNITRLIWSFFFFNFWIQSLLIVAWTNPIKTKTSEKPWKNQYAHGTHSIQIEMINKRKTKHTPNEIGYENSENIECNERKIKLYIFFKTHEFRYKRCFVD